jgi:hypothetical protein
MEQFTIWFAESNDFHDSFFVVRLYIESAVIEAVKGQGVCH